MNLFRSFLIVLFFTFSLNAADECTSVTTTTHNFVNGVPYNGSGNTKGSDGDNLAAYYYFTVPESGTITFTALTGNVTYSYSGSACPPTSSTSLVSGSTITFVAADDFNMRVLSSNASGEDFTFSMTFAFSGNQIPIAVDDTAESEGVDPTIIDVLNNDYDLDGSLVNSSVTINTNASHGTLSIDPVTGAITYTPVTFAGTDSFTYTVKDNNDATSAPATVTITYPIPVAYDKVYSVIPSGTLNGNVISDHPVDPNYADHNHTANYKDDSTITLGTLTFNIPNDGEFSYAAPGSVTTQSFTYKVTNQYGMVSNEATVWIYVNEYCANAITLLSTDTNCTTNDTNSTSGGVTADSGQYYKFVLAEDGVLDINLTNSDVEADKTILYYDFGNSCPTIFTKGTTSQLDAGYPSKVASLVLDAGTYYVGLMGKSNNNPTHYTIEVTFRSACPGGPPIYPTIFSSVGVNEPGVDYDVDKNIKTKIVNKEFGLRASYLDISGSVATYDGQYTDKPNDVVDMTVVLEHADGDTCSDPKILGQGVIAHNTEYTEIFNLIIESAFKNRRTRITAFDWGALFTDASGLNCNNSALNSGLCLVPACFNNIQNIRSVFPPAFQPAVMTCIYGDGGGDAPCASEAYYGNCGGTKGNISPSQYNVNLGCAMCLAGAMQGDNCSEDEFAIRPNNFNTTMLPDPFKHKAGQGYLITFEGEDINGDPSKNYNESENSTFVVDVNISDSTKLCQEPSIKLNPSVDFTNGTVTDNYALNNIGDFNMTIYEPIGSEFALVDADDSNETERLITPFFQQIRVVPHHFGITGGLENGSNGFTYLSNFEQFPFDADRNISASFDVNISAETLITNAVTSNYTSECYAKNGNLKLTLADAINKDNPETDSLTKLLWYHYTPDDNGSIPLVLGTTEYNLPFSSTQFDSNDTNGTAEFNYKINFDRNTSKVVNPFAVVVNEINATDTDNVSGVNIGGNATFVYGRTHASRQRYQGDTGTANIYFESYCSGTDCVKTLLPNG
ncbi:Ig-like domain-containing protein, partial [Sulfurimonas sp.]|uniref:Ig-like domain-containing protein n=1 Tax=Sulfurimonas sp. TaxID=2022749 RepID=UPI0019D80ADB